MVKKQMGSMLQEYEEIRSNKQPKIDKENEKTFEVVSGALQEF